MEGDLELRDLVNLVGAKERDYRAIRQLTRLALAHQAPVDECAVGRRVRHEEAVVGEVEGERALEAGNLRVRHVVVGVP